jgi:hypothetical protein
MRAAIVLRSRSSGGPHAARKRGPFAYERIR